MQMKFWRWLPGGIAFPESEPAFVEAWERLHSGYGFGSVRSHAWDWGSAGG
jgi:hypothetical protein